MLEFQSVRAPVAWVLTLVFAMMKLVGAPVMFGSFEGAANCETASTMGPLWYLAMTSPTSEGPKLLADRSMVPPGMPLVSSV